MNKEQKSFITSGVLTFASVAGITAGYRAIFENHAYLKPEEAVGYLAITAIFVGLDFYKEKRSRSK